MEGKKALYPNNHLIPYFLYSDDMEINNPLGSHAKIHSVCNVYYSFPCLPAKQSKLKNIFLAATLKSSDTKTFGIEICFKTLMKELKELEEIGLNINVSDSVTMEVHFILGLVIGDNLSVNSLLGFSQSFSSTFFCRLCKAGKLETQTAFSEKRTLIRTIDGYENELKNKHLEKTSITSDCVFNEIPSFHAVSN